MKVIHVLLVFGCIVIRGQHTTTTTVKNRYAFVEIDNTTATLCANHHLCNTTTHSSRRTCQCDKACTVFNDCCTDFSSDSYTENTRLPNVFDFREITADDLECRTTNQESGESFWFVTQCPKGLGIISERCSRPICNDTWSTIPVTDSYGISYINVYCAVCHNVDTSNLTAWDVQANCDLEVKSIIEDKAIEPDMNALCSKCEFTSKAPRGDIDHPVAIRPCVFGMVSECNQNDTTESTQEMCDSYMAVIDVNGTRYRNPHCFMCNTIEHSTNQRQSLKCDDVHIPRLIDSQSHPVVRTPVESPIFGTDKDQGIIKAGYRPSVNGIPLSVVLDFGSYESSSVRIYYHKEIIKETILFNCPQGKVYAELPNGGECLTLSCPVGMKMVNGDCVSLYISQLTESTNTEWCRQTQTENTVTLSGIAKSSHGSFCQNQSLINHTFNCLFDVIGRENTFKWSDHCQLSGNIEIVLTIDNEQDYLQRVQNKLEEVNSRDLNVSGDSLCDLDKIVLTQTCLHQTEEHTCTSVWLPKDDTSLSRLNDTHFIYHNISIAWHSTEHISSRVTYQSSSIGLRKDSEIKLCSVQPFLACPFIILNTSLFARTADDETYLTYLPSGRNFSSQEYLQISDGQIKVCNFLNQWSSQNETLYYTFFKYSKIQTILSTFGSAISMIAAVVTFATYYVFPSLRNSTTHLIMNLVVAIFLGQILLLLGGNATQNEDVCFTFAVLTHYAWLAVFTCMNALAFNLDRTFGNPDSLNSIISSKRYFVFYITYSWGAPLLVLGPCVIVHFCQCTPYLQFHYGSSSACWISNGQANLLTFGAPVGAFLCINLILFAHTVKGIWSTKRRSGRVYIDSSAMKRAAKELIIYIKLSTVMGFTWIFGYVAAFTELEAFWYLYIVLNSLHGLFIFMSFIFNRRVGALWSSKLSRVKPTPAVNLRFGEIRRSTKFQISNNTKVRTLSRSNNSVKVKREAVDVPSGII